MAEKLTAIDKFIRFKRVRDALAPLARKARGSKYKYIKVPVQDILDLDRTIKDTMGGYAQWIEKEKTDDDEL